MINRPHIRYRKVWFDENWLEEFLLKEMGWTADVMFSKSEFAHDNKRKALFYYVLHKYCGLSATQIAHRYAQYFDYVDKLITKARDSHWVDKHRVAAILEPYLPLKQFETYR